MHAYRLYCLNEAGGIMKAEEIHALNDAEAITQVRAAKKRVSCELWDRDRLVANIPPHPKPSA
jgi:hypothetical protein